MTADEEIFNRKEHMECRERQSGEVPCPTTSWLSAKTEKCRGLESMRRAASEAGLGVANAAVDGAEEKRPVLRHAEASFLKSVVAYRLEILTKFQLFDLLIVSSFEPGDGGGSGPGDEEEIPGRVVNSANHAGLEKAVCW